MKSSEFIRNEKDPFLREVWCMGYDSCQEDIINQEIILIRNSDKFVKRIPSLKLTDRYTIKKTTLIYRKDHRWLSEADGSADRFREIINPKN